MLFQAMHLSFKRGNPLPDIFAATQNQGYLTVSNFYMIFWTKVKFFISFFQTTTFSFSLEPLGMINEVLGISSNASFKDNDNSLLFFFKLFNLVRRIFKSANISSADSPLDFNIPTSFDLLFDLLVIH